ATFILAVFPRPVNPLGAARDLLIYIKFCNKIIAPADRGMGGGCLVEYLVLLLDNRDICNFFI
ncbi:hypothetical protein, partial [Limnospira fusiformis]|uniref:hypothetical protein n=1 Tax=Limnospira fusiformis TaxID=54297 RepID=UPI002AA1FDA0|nr:hypothetical protein [Limnospira fusiformis LS22]